MKKSFKILRSTPLSFGLLTLLCILGASGKALAFSGSGAGSSGSPYQITTCNQMSEIESSLSAHYELANDIDCNGSSFVGSLGLGGSGFSGTFDGQEHSINSLDLSNRSDSAGSGGIFSRLSNATVSNLRVINAQVNGAGSIGILAGGAQLTDTIDNVYVSGVVTCHDDYCGGLIGYAVDNHVTISNSGADVSVISTGDYVGGIAGRYEDSTISQTYSTGTVSGDNNVGGIAGIVSGAADINNVYYSGSVVALGSNAGGLVGAVELGGQITNAYAAGSVKAGDSVGGLVGDLGDGVISHAFAANFIDTSEAVIADPLVASFTFDVSDIASHGIGLYFDSDTAGIGASGFGTDEPTVYFIENSSHEPMASWTFDSSHWRTNFNTYPSFIPMIDPFMLCEEATSTHTTIHGKCGVFPLGWGTATWEVRWSVHGKNSRHTVDLDDVRFPESTVTGLTPGTWYDLQFRYTNDFGIGPWGRVEILTTGKKPKAVTSSSSESTPITTVSTDESTPADTTVATSSDTPETTDTVPSSTDASIVDPKASNSHGYTKYYWVGGMLAILALVGLLKGSLPPPKP